MNARFAVGHSYSTHPKAQMSTRLSSTFTVQPLLVRPARYEFEHEEVHTFRLIDAEDPRAARMVARRRCARRSRR